MSQDYTRQLYREPRYGEALRSPTSAGGLRFRPSSDTSGTTEGSESALPRVRPAPGAPAAASGWVVEPVSYSARVQQQVPSK